MCQAELALRKIIELDNTFSKYYHGEQNYSASSIQGVRLWIY